MSHGPDEVDHGAAREPGSEAELRGGVAIGGCRFGEPGTGQAVAGDHAGPTATKPATEPVPVPGNQARAPHSRPSP
ncbi:hypothetical protein GCM10009838_74650 [Catenulispora subtropica]|uniref:Uncharacterized protein n=1 Tax=Catenulispora subtropica TaxID=450798 RepID=A0ABP5EL81_9ACTN